MEIKKSTSALINLFIEECGEPDDNSKLIEYLTFIDSYSVKFSASDYCEIHHILPQSSFPKFKKAKWNQVKLLYTDHILVHELLAQAYITRGNLRTLNFMNSQVSKNSELISIAAKKGWVKLKSNPDTYSNWKSRHSVYMKSVSNSEQSSRSTLAWSRIKQDPVLYKKRCDINKANWTEDLKLKKSQSMKKYFADNPTESSARSMKRWSNTDEVTRKQFSDKVRESLSDPIVKDKISTKLKTKWQDPTFIEKMKTREPVKKKYEIISPTGETFIRTGTGELIAEFDFSPSLIRKFANTGKPVYSKYLKNKQVQNTIGWTFNILK